MNGEVCCPLNLGEDSYHRFLYLVLSLCIGLCWEVREFNYIKVEFSTSRSRAQTPDSGLSSFFSEEIVALFCVS